MIRKTLYLLAMIMLPLMSFAQSDDFGVWTSISADKKVNKKISVGIEAEMRTRDNSEKIDRWSFGVEAKYKLTKWLKASVGYSLLDDNNYKITYKALNGAPNKLAEYWGVRHRFNVSLTASQKFGNFQVSLRERWQYTYRPEKTIDQRWDFDDDEYDGKAKTYSGRGKNIMRSRVQISYDIPNSHFEPYVSAEMYNGWSVEKMRYTAGVDWKITKRHAVGAYYLYQAVHDDDDDNEPNLHILGLEYKFKF